MRFLAQLYHGWQKQIYSFLDNNKQFTFVNGFNVIDTKDLGYISFRQLKAFLLSTGISFNEQKMITLFSVLSESTDSGAKSSREKENMKLSNNRTDRSKTRIIHYRDFVQKLFGLTSVKDFVQQCRKRKPLLSQEWPSDQGKNYCRFLRAVANILDDILKSKKVLL